MNTPSPDQIADNPELMLTMSNDELFAIEWPDVKAMQLKAIQSRFDDMRGRIKMLTSLTDDLGIKQITKAEDITPLCFPHTVYKSYSMSYIEKGRYDRLNSWLQGLTTHNIEGIDTSSCDSLESWLSLLEQNTDMRPQGSSGTTGKCSFFPRGTAEEKFRFENYLKVNESFRDEPGSTLRSGDIDFFSPWPVATGRHNIPGMFNTLRKWIYHDKENPAAHVHTLGKGHWDLDLIWLSARITAAQARGETLKMTPVMQRLRERLQEEQKAAPGEDQVERFIHELMVDFADKPVFLFAPFQMLIPLAQECAKRGYKGLHPDSYILGGGKSGSKGIEFPDDWREQCEAVFPPPYQEIYGMTESTSIARLCSAGQFHMPPTIALFQLDPDTSAPLERTGTQTGRLALFDLLPTSYWGGMITGDRITINWDGGCSCGRKGPYIDDDIVRYSNLRDDDKITCSKSPDAYEKAVELTLGAMFD